jgi:hypothetical protein
LARVSGKMAFIGEELFADIRAFQGQKLGSIVDSE